MSANVLKDLVNGVVQFIFEAPSFVWDAPDILTAILRFVVVICLMGWVALPFLLPSVTGVDRISDRLEKLEDRFKDAFAAT